MTEHQFFASLLLGFFLIVGGVTFAVSSNILLSLVVPPLLFLILGMLVVGS